MRLELGRIGRAHGLRGEVHLVPITNVEGRFAPGVQVWVGDDPLVIEASRRHQDRWVVKFAGVDDRTAAEHLRGRLVTAEPLADTDDEMLWVHRLVGARVTDRAGTELGTVRAVEANP